MRPYPAPLRTATKVTGKKMQVRILSDAPYIHNKVEGVTTLRNRIEFGRMGERFMPAVLKTAVPAMVP